MARLKEYYVKDVAPALMKKFSYKSVMQIPKLDKIVINVSCGEARDNAKVIEAIVADLSAITGQRPVVCDFRGISPNSFDGRGNYNMGLKDQLIFPEIDYDKIDKVRGMDICFVTTANTDEEARELLGLMGAPFAK